MTWNNRIYISRASADNEAAFWVVGILEANGYVCIVNDRDFKIGASFPHNMRAAFESCDTTLALMSPDYWESIWCIQEWEAAYAFDQGGSGKLIPVMLQQSMLPKLQQSLEYLDFTKISETDRAARLLDAVTATLTENKPLPDRLHRNTIPLSNISFITENFVGRKEDLAALTRALWAERDMAALTVISGLGGVGKSAIAREYARRHQHRYAGTWLVRSELKSEMLEDLAALAVKLKPDLREVNDISALADAAFELATLHARSEKRPFLFVFDNVVQEGDVPEKARTNDFHTIATSRWEAWNDARLIEISKMPDEAAAELMLSITSRKAEEDGFADLMTAFDGLTLAIVQAGSYLRENRFESFADYHAALIKRLGEKATGARNADGLVSATFLPSIEKAEAEAPGARELLMSTAFFAPDDIPLAILAEEADSDETKKAASALLRYSLVTEGKESEFFGPSISLHRLLQTVLRGQLDDSAKKQLLIVSAERIAGKFPEEPIYNNSPVWPQIAPLVDHITDLQLHDQRGVGGSALSFSLNLAAAFYESQASYSLAKSLYENALAIDETNLGPEHPIVGARLENLALLLKKTNRYEEAEFLFRRALKIDEARYGLDHPAVATDLNNLASLLQSTNRLEEAEDLYRRSLSIGEASYNRSHPTIATRLNNLAGLLGATNRLDEAESYYRRALAIDEASYGLNHPEVATDLNNLASLLAQTGRAGEALPLAQRAHAIWTASLPEGHPNRVTIEQSLPMIELQAKVEAAGMDWEEFLKAAMERAKSESPD